MNRRMGAYFAAPLFNENERQFNATLAHALEGYADIFLPQRNGQLLADLVAKGMPLIPAEKIVFAQDIEAMRRADLLIAVLDGGYVDEGVAFEIGFSYAIGKRCIGLQTGVRRALPTGNNPMISQSLDKIFCSKDALVSYIQEFANGSIAYIDGQKIA